MSKIYSFGYTKANGQHNNYFVLEKKSNGNHLEGIDLLDNDQYKTFKVNHLENLKCLLNVDDSQLANHEVVSLKDLCSRVNFHPGHVDLVGMNNFLNAANGTLAKGKKVVQLTQDKFLLYGSNVRQVYFYNRYFNTNPVALNIGADGTALTASLNGKVLTNTELYNWINKK